MTRQEAWRRIVEAEESRRERRARAEQQAAQSADRAWPEAPDRIADLRWEQAPSTPIIAS